jgi:hypothetical protein
MNCHLSHLELDRGLRPFTMCITRRTLNTYGLHKLYDECNSSQMQANTQPYFTIQSPSEQTDAFIYSATSRIYRRSEQANELSLVAFRV